MLRASHRLSVRQFEEAFEKGRVLHSSFFALRYLIASPTKADAASVVRAPAKVGVVASQKVAKTAARRIYLRRKTYEMVKPLYESLPKGLHAIIFVKMSPATAAEQAADLRALFAQAGLLG